LSPIIGTSRAISPTLDKEDTMTKAHAKQIIAVNLAFWIVAMLLNPLSQMIPTGSGSPPKVYELLIPICFIMLAGGSTYLLKSALETPKDD
jgi:hypothetical protein